MRKLLLFVLVSWIVTSVTAQIYVTESSSGAHNGTSWADAYTDLQEAIYQANAGDTIWVAVGFYKPSIDTTGTLPSIPERRSFWLKNGVVIYGGFDGTETSLSQRDPINGKAHLVGELTTGIHAEHVINVYAGIDSTAVIDGFVVRDGKSLVTSTEKNGAGMILRGDARFTNIHFSNPTIRGVPFMQKTASPCLSRVTSRTTGRSSTMAGLSIWCIPILRCTTVCFLQTMPNVMAEPSPRWNPI
jgi:hypothetical protein